MATALHSGQKRKREDDSLSQKNGSERKDTETGSSNHHTETESSAFKRPRKKKPRKQTQSMSSIHADSITNTSNHPHKSHHHHSSSQSNHYASSRDRSSSSKYNHHHHKSHRNHYESDHRRSHSSHSRSHHDHNRRHNHYSKHTKHSRSYHNSEDWSQDPDNVILKPRKRVIKSEPKTHVIHPNHKQSKNNTHFDEDKAWKYAESDRDRRWYLHENGESDPNYNPFGGAADSFNPKSQRKKVKQEPAKEPTMFEKWKEKYQKREEKKKKNIPRITQLERDNAKWEEQMLYRSGVIKQVNESELLFDEEVEHRTHVLVRDMQPPFLDGRQQFSRQLKSVSVVKDATSDMAVIARKGSHTLFKWRENRDKKKIQSHEKWWEVGKKSKQGQVVGVTKDQLNADDGIKKEDEEQIDDEAYDYKKSSQYAHSMKHSKSQAISNFAKNKTLKEQREYLPIFKVRDQLMQIVRDNQIIVLVGQTGSGKTTQITQYLYEDGFADLDGSMIICTQPRRVAAMSVAKRVAEETGSTLGGLVGYSIRFEDCTSAQTKIKYCTDGVLLREALNPETLDKYSVIIMDEAHERSLHTDILFGVLRGIVATRRDLKLIVTSATLDSAKFSSFFSGAPVFLVPGRTFKVEINWSKTVCDDPLDAAVKTVMKIHITKQMGDILVFMTGQEDIRACCQLIAERLTAAQEDSDTIAPLTILPIYSQLPSDLQTKIFEPTEDGSRKCIVSTNIAETSLTVDGIKYVVDLGYCKLKVFKSKMGMDALSVVPISRANADQRKGRAGRTNHGEVFRLYTRLQFQIELLANTVPEIQRTNLGNVVLLLKSLGVDDLLDFDFMDPPPQQTLVSSMYQLWILGALDNAGNLTDLGKKMVQYPLDPPLSKQLMFSIDLGCSAEILTIVSMLSVPSIFFRPENKATESDAAREKFFRPESDHLTLLNIYQSWQRQNYNAYWCKKHYILIKTMRKVREIRAQLEDIMQSKRHKIESTDDWDIVRKAICSAYFQNAAKLKGIGEYVNMRKGIPCHLHPSSALFGMGYNPEYVVYHELVMTRKEYMRNVTAVDGAWLAELGSMFFSLKEDHEARKQQEIYEKEIMEQDLKMLSAKKAKEKAMKDLAELARHKQSQQVFHVGKRFKSIALMKSRQKEDEREEGDEDDMINLSNLKKTLKRNKR
eukprot:437026_1